MQPSTTTRSARVKQQLTAVLVVLVTSAVPVKYASAGGFSISWGNPIQGSGKVVEVPRTVSTFDRITVVDGIHVVLRRGAEQKLSIKTDDNIQPLIEARVEGMTLQLKMRPQTSIRMNYPITVNIDYTQLSSLKVSDAASADLDAIKVKSFSASAHDGSQLRLGAVEVSDFELLVVDGSHATVGAVLAAATQRYRVADGARLKVDKAGGERVIISVADGAQMSLAAVDAKNIDVSVADGAKADIAGVAQKQSYALTDAANVNAQRLQGTSALVRASDGSSLSLGQLQTLDADVQDGSKVRYTGDPTITQRLRDGASLKRI